MDMTEQQMIDYLRENGYEVYSKEEDEERENDFFHLSEDYKQNIIEKCKLKKELKEIKGKIESGQAVILPCKVGDKVYSINKRWLNGELYIDDRFIITAISISKNKIDLFIGIEGSEIEDGLPFVKGRDFFTKEAAEAKLKELRRE